MRPTFVQLATKTDHAAVAPPTGVEQRTSRSVHVAGHRHLALDALVVRVLVYGRPAQQGDTVVVLLHPPHADHHLHLPQPHPLERKAVPTRVQVLRTSHTVRTGTHPRDGPIRCYI
eukprot:1288870-Pyramimonas_sp.AAC.2